MIATFLDKIPVSDAVLAGIEAGIIVLMAALLVLRHKRRKTQEKLAGIYNKRQRDEDLMLKIRNSGKEDPVKSVKPYEVIYNQEENSGAGITAPRSTHNIIRLQLIVKTKVAVQKFLVDLDTEFRIGRKPANDLVLDDEMVSSSHCALMNRAGKVFAVDLRSTNGTVLQRRSEKIRLNTNPVMLREGDKLVIAGDSTVEIHFR